MIPFLLLALAVQTLALLVAGQRLAAQRRRLDDLQTRNDYLCWHNADLASALLRERERERCWQRQRECVVSEN